MPIFLLRAVRKSADGLKSAHVASMWPYRAPNLTEAKRFVDHTPDSVWSDADTFEVADDRGRRLACRAIRVSAGDEAADPWSEESEDPAKG